MTPTADTQPALIAVQPVKVADLSVATVLAERLHLPLLAEAASNTRNQYACEFVLLVDAAHLRLQSTGKGAPGPVEVDFGSGRMRHRRRASTNELLGRAVGAGKRQSLRVVDATAGLARDAFVLADLGCEVTLCEQNPVVACLIEAGLDRAVNGEDSWLRETASRMRLHSGDARELAAAIFPHDVIYLDPMFPGRTKQAAVAKEMAVLQRLLAADTMQGEPEKLLDWACRQDVARVVVKRPLRAGVLSALAPSHALRGRSVRYDVYVNRAL